MELGRRGFLKFLGLASAAAFLPGGGTVSEISAQATPTTGAWASGAASLKRGDVITFEGTYSVNQVTGEETGRLQQFVVVADVDVDGSCVTYVPISPAIIASGPYQTVSAMPEAGATITYYRSGPESKEPQRLAFWPHRIGTLPRQVVPPMSSANTWRR